MNVVHHWDFSEEFILSIEGNLYEFRREVSGFLDLDRSSVVQVHYARHHIAHEKKKSKFLEEKINLLKEQISIFSASKFELEKKIIESPFGFSYATLENALKTYTDNKKQHLIKMTVGGKLFLYMTDYDPQASVASVIEAAKQNGQEKIHIQLRRFGYLYEYEVIKTIENEIEGLVQLQIQCEKIQPVLGCVSPFVSTNFELVEIKNKQNELVLGVRVNSLKEEQSKIENSKTEISLMEEKIEVLEKAILNVNCRIEKLSNPSYDY